MLHRRRIALLVFSSGAWFMTRDSDGNSCGSLVQMAGLLCRSLQDMSHAQTALRLPFGRRSCVGSRLLLDPRRSGDHTVDVRKTTEKTWLSFHPVSVVDNFFNTLKPPVGSRMCAYGARDRDRSRVLTCSHQVHDGDLSRYDFETDEIHTPVKHAVPVTHAFARSLPSKVFGIVNSPWSFPCRMHPSGHLGTPLLAPCRCPVLV